MNKQVIERLGPDVDALERYLRILVDDHGFHIDSVVSHHSGVYIVIYTKAS